MQPPLCLLTRNRPRPDPQRGPAPENCGVLIGLVVHIDFYRNNLVQAGPLTFHVSVVLFKAV